MTAIPDTSEICAPIHRRRGAPVGNRNALKSGRYTAEAKGERRRNRLLLRQLRAGMEYARSVIRTHEVAARLAIFPPPGSAEKIFKNRKTIPARRGQLPALHYMRGYCRILESGESHLPHATKLHGGRGKNFQKSKNNSRKAGVGSAPFHALSLPIDRL
jgi:hypothetical protein